MTEAGVGRLQRVLIVDDDPVSLDLVSAMVEREGCVADTLIDSTHATAHAVETSPDLVILDVMMPVKNGFEVCTEMKQTFGNRYVPIILLTALEDVENIERGFEAGADDYVSKPFEPRILLARLRSCLRAKALWDELNATQAKLIEAERLAAIGEMTVTLKHEINNPLQTIIGYADYLMTILPPNHEFYPQVEAICKGGERIAELLKKLDHVRRVATTEYLGERQMVDLEKSTEGDTPAGDPTGGAGGSEPGGDAA